MNRFFRYEKGFTLLELLIAMAVIGVLGSVLIVAIDPMSQLNKAADAERKADIAAIQGALEQYRADTSAYPIRDELQCGLPLSRIVNGATVTYLNKIPCDPKSNASYFYDVDGTTGNYCLRACLSRPSDSQSDLKVYGTENALGCGLLVTDPNYACTSGSYTVIPQ